MLIDFILGLLCGFLFLIAYQPLCSMDSGWHGGCHKLKYLSLMTCSLVPAYLVIKDNQFITAFIVYVTLFMCLWPRILWWVRHDFLDFLSKHFPELHISIQPKVLRILEWMFNK